MSELLFEKSVPGRQGWRLPRLTPEEASCEPRLPAGCLAAAPPGLPELGELDVVRHFTRLSQRNFCVDTHFYPLGSCTMKYNPKVCEKIAALEGFAGLHPLLPQLPGGRLLAQGALEVLHETARLLGLVCGMDAFSLQPMAGAHGELTGMMMIAAFHRRRGDGRRRKVLVPDSAHGTNPASAAMAGYEVVTLPSGADGCISPAAFGEALSEEVAAVMLTCPNTLGLFERQVHEIAAMAHARGALLYYDGANLNALLGRCRPGDLGFDVMHLNLHKTFGTPHGGGGPGAGPGGAPAGLAPFLPAGVVVRRDDGTFALDEDRPLSIGRVAPFQGNFGVILRAYAYLLLLGEEGMREVSGQAVLNANYVRERLKGAYDLPFDRRCMHECVFSAARQAARGVRAADIAKALIDRGFHPPTICFPLTVKEALMIEPTETESQEQLDRFIAAMLEIAGLAERDPAAFRDLPAATPVSRLDETRAARERIFAV